MTKTLPVLSLGDSFNDGSYLQSPTAIGQQLLANYLVTDIHQSYFFAPLIYSAANISQNTPDDNTSTVEKTKEDLIALYSLYFDNVEVEVVLKGQALYVYIRWSYQNKTYSHKKDIRLTDKTLYRTINNHNTGNVLNDKPDYD